jgi:hypothetical protein
MKPREILIKRLTFKRRVTNKFKAWGKRFLLAEICGASLAVIASYLTIIFSQSAVFAAYAGAAGDTIGFYVPIIVQDSLAMRRELRAKNKRFGWGTILRLVKNMLLEFGPAEVIDSLFLRPFFMYYFPILLHNYPIGILAGKLAGDVTFYIPVTISNRLRAVYKRYRA